MTEPHDEQTPPPHEERIRPLPPVDPAGSPAWVSTPWVTSSSVDLAAGPDTPARRARWTGRKSAMVLASALGLGTVGAIGATAAVAQSDERGGAVGGHGQFPGGGPGHVPGGPGRPPAAGPGRLPGSPPPGGDRDGDHRGLSGRDADGDHGVGHQPSPRGGTGPTGPEDANGGTSAQAT